MGYIISIASSFFLFLIFRCEFFYFQRNGYIEFDRSRGGRPPIHLVVIRHNEIMVAFPLEFKIDNPCVQFCFRLDRLYKIRFFCLIRLYEIRFSRLELRCIALIIQPVQKNKINIISLHDLNGNIEGAIHP